MRVHNRTSRRRCPLTIIHSIFATDGKIELLSAATGTMLGGMGEVHGLWQLDGSASAGRSIHVNWAHHWHNTTARGLLDGGAW